MSELTPSPDYIRPQELCDANRMEPSSGLNGTQQVQISMVFLFSQFAKVHGLNAHTPSHQQQYLLELLRGATAELTILLNVAHNLEKHHQGTQYPEKVAGLQTVPANQVHCETWAVSNERQLQLIDKPQMDLHDTKPALLDSEQLMTTTPNPPETNAPIVKMPKILESQVSIGRFLEKSSEDVNDSVLVEEEFEYTVQPIVDGLVNVLEADAVSYKSTTTNQILQEDDESVVAEDRALKSVEVDTFNDLKIIVNSETVSSDFTTRRVTPAFYDAFENLHYQTQKSFRI